MTLFSRRRLIEKPRSGALDQGCSNGLALRQAGVWRGRVVTAGLWGLVCLAAIGGTAGLVRPSGAPVVVAAPAAEPAASAAVMGTAEWAVRTVLPAETADAAGMAVAAPGRRESVVVDQAVRVVSATAIAAVSGEREGSWTVTVAAQVVVAPTGPLVWWFLTVGVVDTDTGPVVVSDPALISAPGAAVGRVELAGSLRPPDDSDAAVATTVSFLTALLSGDPAVGRWTAPGFDVPYPAVGAEVFADVTVERVATTMGEESRSVRAEVTATTASDGVVHLAYEVQVQVRSGRWEVTGFGPPTPTGADPIEPGSPPPPVAAPSSPTDPVTAEPAPDVTGPSGATAGPSPTSSTSTTPVTNGPPPAPEGET